MERNLYSKYPDLGISLLIVVDVALFGVLSVTVWAVQMLWIPFGRVVSSTVSAIFSVTAISALLTQHECHSPWYLDWRRRTAQQSPCLCDIREAVKAMVRVRYRLDVYLHLVCAGTGDDKKCRAYAAPRQRQDRPRRQHASGRTIQSS